MNYVPKDPRDRNSVVVSSLGFLFTSFITDSTGEISQPINTMGEETTTKVKPSKQTYVL